MGYFSNGTEGDAFEGAICSGCVHYISIEEAADKGGGCPVWLAHLLYNYDQFNDGQEKLKSTLSILMTTNEPGHPPTCNMRLTPYDIKARKLGFDKEE